MADFIAFVFSKCCAGALNFSYNFILKGMPPGGGGRGRALPMSGHRCSLRAFSAGVFGSHAVRGVEVATVVTVHGTYAHSGGMAEALQIGGDTPPEWWQQNSEFEADLKRAVTGSADGTLDVVPFTWSAANSETDRRKGGTALLKVLRQLDARGEPYALVGHSHGGSVIAAALIESVARGAPLTHLKRWITVGTPFVGMRRERFLFTRLTLTRKVVFVGSLMLAMMFLFYVGAEVFSGALSQWQAGDYEELAFSGAMMSLPVAFFYLMFRFLDNRELVGYRRGTAKKAREAYGHMWLPLCHKDDEAVHGLRFLPKVDLHFFDDDFAAGALTKAAIVALPLLYLVLVTSPSMMLGISDFLQSKVYGVERFAGVNQTARRARGELRDIRRRMRDAEQQAERGMDAQQAEEARARAREYRRQMWQRRRDIEIKFPEFVDAERAQRFKERFLERNGQTCRGARLCGMGHDYFLNSKLLFHAVTDELTHAVVNDDTLGGTAGSIVRLLIPIVLVPVVFALIALGVLAVIQYLASYLSVWISRMLNRLTRAEVKRSSFGNDTEGEVVTGADYGPSWLDPVVGILPEQVSNEISDHSNTMMAQSVVKFRNAIGTLAFAESEDRKSSLVESYLSWKELVHTCYFDVSGFRKIVAYAISQTPGFMPTETFQHDPDYTQVAAWTNEFLRKPNVDPATGLALADGEAPLGATAAA